MPIYIVWPIYCFCKTRTVAIRHRSGVLWGRKSTFFQGKHNEAGEVSNRTNACMWKMLRSMDQHLVRTTAKHHIPIIFTPALASHMAPPEQTKDYIWTLVAMDWPNEIDSTNNARRKRQMNAGWLQSLIHHVPNDLFFKTRFRQSGEIAYDLTRA